MNESKIAVLIPTYKPGSYLQRCLINLDRQTLATQDYKVYIALNGPKAPFMDYILKICRQLSMIAEVLHIEQAGVSNARNKLLDMVNEEYIVFVDDDDVVSSNYLAALFECTDKTNMGISNVFNFTENIEQFSENYIGKSFSKLHPMETSKYRCRKYFSSPCGKMLHKNMISRTRFDVKLKVGEDSLFMAELSKNINGIRKTTADAIYYVCQRSGSATRSPVNHLDEIKRICYLTHRYSKLLFSNEYDRVFMLTRIAATLKHLQRLTQ